MSYTGEGLILMEIGTCPVQNEDDIAAQIVGFLQQFLEVFSELDGKKLYLSGESVRVSRFVSCFIALIRP